MPFVIVVKQDEPGLYDYLRESFVEPDVTVILDQRHRDRRRAVQPVTVERRRSERRAPPADYDRLWRYGFRVAIAQPGSERPNGLPGGCRDTP